MRAVAMTLFIGGFILLCVTNYWFVISLVVMFIAGFIYQKAIMK